MIRPRPTSRNLLWLLLGAICFASMAFYTVRVWSANQSEHFSDLYAPWWGAHELLLHGRNPYSPAVAREIQTVIYGKAVIPTPDDPMGVGGGFAYPPYAALLLWPTIYTSFGTAEKLFLFLSVSLTLLSILLWLRALRISVSPWHFIALALFVFGSFPVLQGLKLLNLSLVAAAFIAIAVFLLSADHSIWAGVFLAASTFKPQFIILLVPWLALWSLTEWRVRWRLALSFLMTMLLLLLVSELLLPSGLRHFLAVARAYHRYTYGHSVLDVWFTPKFGPVASAALLLTVLKLTWRPLAAAANTARFVGVVSFLLAATVVVIPTLAPHVQLLLLPGLILLVEGHEKMWNSGPPGRLLLTGAGALLAWSWVAALGLVAASFRQPLGSLIGFWEVPLYTSTILPLAVFLALACQLRPWVPGEAAHGNK